MNKSAVSERLITYRLKNIGEFYSGDGYDIPTGAITDFPARKAQQLLQDFPNNWITVEKEKPDYTKVDLIMLAHSSRKLAECIDSLYANTPEGFKLTVVHNKNNDSAEYKKTALLLGKKKKQYGFDVVKTNSCGSYSRNCNIGFKNTERAVVVFLNDDLEFIDGDWLDSMIDLLSDSKVGFAGPTLKTADMNDFGLARPYWISGACFAVRRALLIELGGWDEGYPFYWEETDLCEASHRKGLQNLRSNIFVIHHYVDKYHEPWHIENFRYGEKRFKEKWGI